MTLTLINNLTKKEYTFDNLEDQLVSRLFYTLDITLESGMDDGEYNYSLTNDEGRIRATGLLQVGDYVANNNTYTANTKNGYVQYNGSI